MDNSCARSYLDHGSATQKTFISQSLSGHYPGPRAIERRGNRPLEAPHHLVFIYLPIKQVVNLSNILHMRLDDWVFNLLMPCTMSTVRGGHVSRFGSTIHWHSAWTETRIATAPVRVFIVSSTLESIKKAHNNIIRLNVTSALRGHDAGQDQKKMQIRAPRGDITIFTF
jgi:hypothetical protein